MTDYAIDGRWTVTHTQKDGNKQNAVTITVDDRAATRQTIINRLARKGYTLIERSAWHAVSPRRGVKPSNWDYQDIVIHHAGRSYSCGVLSVEEMKRVQTEDMARAPSFDDVGYHYAISCEGEIYEARDIRFIGEHVEGANTGKIGVVFLADFVQPGEAYEQEYSRLSLIDKMKQVRNIMADQMVSKHDNPTMVQINAALALCEILKDVFSICSLGGHREYQQLSNHKGRACPGNLGMSIVMSLRAQLALSLPRA